MAKWHTTTKWTTLVDAKAAIKRAATYNKKKGIKQPSRRIKKYYVVQVLVG